MRQFKFVGDPHGYNNVPVFGSTYDENDLFMILTTRTILEWSKIYPEDWQEVFENDSPWISIKDSLPEEGGRYWCYVKEITDLGISYYQWNCSYHEIEKRWTENTYIVPIVTHWMPLPEPPKR